MIGSTLGPYRVLEKIGAGGMGEVYRATDSRLGRDVAVKILPEELARDPLGLERFQREARAASALSHSNIAAIHDIGEHEGRHFIVMELLEGRTLRERIAASPIGWSEMLDVAIQIADGLEAAHASGIVHRDIKPANLFIAARGQVKILDFGLAKVTPRGPVTSGGSALLTAGFGNEHLTSPGTALGTVGYMSPEQARGEELDPRTDLFSLGAVLYEMATRCPAFPGDTTAVVFDGILNRPPIPPLQLNRNLPPQMAEVIGKLLEKDRDFRIQSAAELRANLKRLKRDLSSGPASGAPIEESAAPRKRAAKPAGKAIDSLAVLPFENASGDSANDELSQGITEGIINTLSKLPKVRVVPRGMVFRYLGKGVDPFTAASELKVRAVVTGRVLQHKETLIVKAELVDIDRQDQLWGDSYNRKMTDLLEVQDDIAREISRHLQQKLSPDSGKRARPRVTRNPEAYRLYLQGLHQSQQWSEEGLRKGVNLLQQSIDLDATHAPSYAGLGYAMAMIGFYGFMPSREAYGQAEAAARKALSLDPSLAEPHAALGWHAMEYQRDWDVALREFRQAIELRPDLAIVRHGIAVLWTSRRRFDEALAEIRKAIELDPLTPLFLAHHGWILHCSGRDDEALSVLQSALELHVDNYYIHRILLYVCATAHRSEFALQIGAKLAHSTKNRQMGRCLEGFAFAAARDVDRARAIVTEILAQPRVEGGIAYFLGLIECLIGEKEKALEWFEKAYEENLGILIILGAEPVFDSLRAEPRFQALLRKLGLLE